MPHYHVIAHRSGYADDVLTYCREHELAHHVIAQEIWGRPSIVLWALAHGMEPQKPFAVFEELAAQILQRWARANERPIVADVDWDGLRGKFLELARSNTA